MSRIITHRMPREIKLGDVIADGSNKGTKVKQVEHYACSKRGTHVNNNECYPWSVPVAIVVS